MFSLLAITLAVTCAAQAPTWPPIDDAIAATGGGANDAAVVVGVAVVSQPVTSAPRVLASVPVAIDWVRSQGIRIARTETTVAQYRACVRAGACSEPDSGTWSSSAGSVENHPVNSVDWYQATAFCGWAGGRLPTADEWQRVATNGGTTEHPWGAAEPDGSRANYNGPDRFDETSPACLFSSGHNRDGVCDLAGNVSEWTASDHDSSNKETRGGSWFCTPPARAPLRLWVTPAWRDDSIGFRCAQ
jgi:formylglycine-generating enzyme required for sulfatase activity